MGKGAIRGLWGSPFTHTYAVRSIVWDKRRKKRRIHLINPHDPAVEKTYDLNESFIGAIFDGRGGVVTCSPLCKTCTPSLEKNPGCAKCTPPDVEWLPPATDETAPHEAAGSQSSGGAGTRPTMKKKSDFNYCRNNTSGKAIALDRRRLGARPISELSGSPLIERILREEEWARGY